MGLRDPCPFDYKKKKNDLFKKVHHGFRLFVVISICVAVIYISYVE